METKWLNARAQALQAGAVRGMFDKAARMQDVVSLGIGEPDMVTPAPICMAGAEALELGMTHYSANAGLLSFRKAAADSAFLPRGAYDPETEIISTVGGMGGLSLCLNTIITPGDEIVIQDPSWLNYAAQIQFAGGVPVCAKTDKEHCFRLRAEDVERAITPRTKALLLNTPCNPTGAVLTQSDLEDIATLARRYDLLVLSDEVYSTLVYDDKKHISIASLSGMHERTLVVQSFSKSFAMTGWRVGFSAGPAHLIEKMTRLQENVNACVPVMAQYAGAYALTRMDLAEQMRQIYAARRKHIVEGLNRINKIHCNSPDGTFYVFADVSDTAVPVSELADRLLEEMKVVVTPGSCFGACGEGHIRLSFANSIENIDKALDRIDSYFGRTFS